MEDTNSEAAYNCKHYTYLNFKSSNTKKRVFCNEEQEYDNYWEL